MVGGILVVLIIFAFLRDFRSTLIVCTSIPVSVIGTFALLYFGGFTLNTMTFGGLALGIGMIVDAAIVLENAPAPAHGQGPHDRRHRRQRVWSAILASTLTHCRVPAAAVPLRHRQHHVHAAVGRRDVLADHVALRGRDDRSGALLPLAQDARRGGRAYRHHGAVLSPQRTLPRGNGRGVSQGHPRCAAASSDGDRRAAALVVLAAVLYPESEPSS